MQSSINNTNSVAIVPTILELPGDRVLDLLIPFSSGKQRELRQI
ncbi:MULTISPECIES: hypothetical protein [unclassified Coleofasciculus]|nr:MULTISPECIES: hypothetical protein [unclassified Coleofasciculus]